MGETNFKITGMGKVKGEKKREHRRSGLSYVKTFQSLRFKALDLR
jgi:hypothetical protein